jgi:osmoprotectant transport system permease protein
VADGLSDFPRLLAAHLELTLLALLVGVALSVPLGVLASRRRALEHLVLTAAGIVQTIPSLALLALMVPLLGALRLANIGFLPAFVALVLYSVLPILRNTTTALANVDPAMLEAARGVGMSPRESLLRVELPLALPVILAGIRTAAVWTVGAATLATPVGAASLGNYIFSGLQTRNPTLVLVGSLGSALLALALDGLMGLCALALARRSRALGCLVLAALLGLFAFVGVSAIARARAARAAPVVIGAKTFTEQYILSEALAEWLGARAGIPAGVRASLGSSVAFDALRTGAVDAYVDYSGTIWATVMKRAHTPSDRGALLAEVRRYLADVHRIELAAVLGFENAYALAMRRGDAERLGVRRISELALRAPELAIGGDYEFFGRPEWQAIRERYGIRFREERAMDPSLMYQAVAAGAVDVIGAFSSDGRIVALDLVVLEDDRGAIPPYDAVVLAGSRLARERPDALAALREVDGRIDIDEMRRMNLAVDRDHRSPKSVARDLLTRWAAGEIKAQGTMKR